MKHPSYYLSVSALLLLLLSSCGIVPVTGRRQINLVSDSEIIASSRLQYTDFIRKVKVDNNSNYGQQTTRVARRVAEATDTYLKNNGYSDIARQMQWEFNLVRDGQVNAFCMPGGKIVVYSGLIQATKATDAELAAVIAHEVSHAIAKHANERISREMMTQLGGQVLTGVVGAKSAALGNIISQTYGIGSKLLISLPYNRKQEYEADQIGLVFMAMAGYDPRAAVTLWQKMSRQGGGKAPEFLSTHPSDANRIRAIQEYLPTALQYYRGDGGRSTGPRKKLPTGTATPAQKGKKSTKGGFRYETQK